MSTAGAPGPSPERVEGPTAPCGMRPTPTTQNCTLLGFRVQPPCLPPSSGEKELMASPTSKPIFAIKFSHCFSTGPEGALEASPRIWATRKFMNILIAKQSKSKGEPQRDNLKYILLSNRRALPDDPTQAIYQRPGTVASSIWPHTFNAKNLPFGHVLGPVLKIRSEF